MRNIQYRYTVAEQIKQLYYEDILWQVAFRTYDITNQPHKYNFKTKYEVVEYVCQWLRPMIKSLPSFINGLNSIDDLDIFIEDIYNKATNEILLIINESEELRSLS